MSKLPKSRQAFTPEFRQQIVELARTGRTPADLAREFGPTAPAIRKWVAQDQMLREKATGGGALTKSEREELQQLRRELRKVTQERDILAKATAWFAARSDKTSTPSSSS